MRRLSLWWMLPWSLLAAGCGSVEVPREHWYRLALPATAGGGQPSAGVLRVGDLQLGPNLPGDCLCVAMGPVELQTRELDRWIAPLDRLVTDAVVLGLSRSRLFQSVKTAGDPGGEDLLLDGRIVDFHEVRDGGPARARAALELWVRQQDWRVFHREFAVEVPLDRHEPGAVAQALSHALGEILGELTGQLRAAGLFVVPPPRPAR